MADEVALVVRAPPSEPAALRRAARAQQAYCEELALESKQRTEERAASSHWTFWWD